MNYDLYEYALNVTQSKVVDICRELQADYGSSALSNIESHIKTEGSIRKKLASKGLSYSDGNIARFKDIAGLRLVFPYLSDIYLLTEKLTVLGDMCVLDIKDYIQNPKPNGYRSLHIIVSIPVNHCGTLLFISVEIQLLDFHLQEHNLR